MAYSIQGTPVITDSRALESVSIKLDNTAIVVTDIIDSTGPGINTTAPRENAIFTEKALMDNIITPIYTRLDDAFNPTDADFSTTAFQAASLEAVTGNIVATAGQFQGDGQGLTNLQAASVVGALADSNVAESNVKQHEGALAIAGTQLTGSADDAFVVQSNVKQHEAALAIAGTQLTGTADDLFIAESNVKQHEAALAIDGTQLTGTAADAFIPASAVTQHEAALSIDGTQLTGTVQDAQFPAILPAVSAENLTNISADTITVAADTTTVGGLPVLFTDADNGAQNPKANSSFTFNPDTGTIEAPGGVNDTSDARVKENIVEIEDGLAKINALRGVTFDWNESAGISGGSVGVIAQELLAVLPEAVDTSNEEKYTVNYNGAIALLISAVKELSAEVEALKAAK